VSEIVGRRTIDLNVDIGEGFPHDVELLKFASSANVCCGAHAGSRELALETIELCRRHRVRIGAHPGYPDRENMGRFSLPAGRELEFLKSLFDQMNWFVEVGEPAYLKPHGAFYNDTAILLPANWETAKKRHSGVSDYESGGLFLAQYPGIQSLLMLVRVHRLALMGLEPTAHRTLAARARQRFIREGFADRRYEANGTLRPRSQPDAVLTDPEEVRDQVLHMAVRVDSICLHGDTPDCLAFAELVYKSLTDAGYGVGV
jgi:UPF0271 protein